LSLKEASARVAHILALRTIKALPFETLSLRLPQAGYILSPPDANPVLIALPLDICGPNEGLAHLVALIASGAEYNYTDEFWVDDIELPNDFVDRFQGPRFGIEGIRSLFKIKSRPIVGVILKPRRGVPLSVLATYALESLLGGADFIADDLLMIDPPGEMAFAKRVPEFVRVAREAARLTGEAKLYFANISTSPLRALHLAEIAQTEGVNILMINAFAMGFSGLEEIISSGSVQVPIITTNMGGGILSRPRQATNPGKPTGISETVISKLSRLAGADGVHAGTSAAECYGQDPWGSSIYALTRPWRNLSGCFAVAEGDLTVANVWENIHSLGPDVILEACTGILGYPGSPRDGAKAFRLLVSNLTFDMEESEARETIHRLRKAKGNAFLDKGLNHFEYDPARKE
jgi:2,3-diketo-5-methylthiopentyl-1-phosphate enolase